MSEFDALDSAASVLAGSRRGGLKTQIFQTGRPAFSLAPSASVHAPAPSQSNYRAATTSIMSLSAAASVALRTEGTATITLTAPAGPAPAPAPEVITVRLRRRIAKPKKGLAWGSNIPDNEFLGRKSSKSAPFSHPSDFLFANSTDNGVQFVNSMRPIFLSFFQHRMLRVSCAKKVE